ncbi:hypothetical protein Taro_020419 [Colocasia esculenta]|uniref:Uncharacterized protein n=1 Tax=Colocasia esculenta TaxID=4460 RepID=A0A843UNL9_COLES|nr:hypothetical protein [Colocasia esculenta]
MSLEELISAVSTVTSADELNPNADNTRTAFAIWQMCRLVSRGMQTSIMVETTNLSTNNIIFLKYAANSAASGCHLYDTPNNNISNLWLVSRPQSTHINQLVHTLDHTAQSGHHLAVHLRRPVALEDAVLEVYGDGIGNGDGGGSGRRREFIKLLERRLQPHSLRLVYGGPPLRCNDQSIEQCTL